MGHTFDRTDLETDFAPDTAARPAPVSRPAPSTNENRIEDIAGQTPLTFPFPMHARSIPLEEPAAAPIRRAS